MIKILAALLKLSIILSNPVRAQDTLPGFSVIAKSNNRNVISWTHTYRKITQVSIQRSSDSTRNFKTILSVPDPTVSQNGFVDSKAPFPGMFYRLFIVLDSGKYQFTKSKRPSPDTLSTAREPVLKSNNLRVVLSDSLTKKEVSALKEKLASPPSAPVVKKAEKFFVIKRKGSYSNLAEKNFRKFRDSIVFITRDTLVFESVDTIVIKPYLPKEIYRASKYIYTEKFGDVMISLPDALTKKYSISFLEENNSPVFEINEVKSTSLIIDKTNFIHSGWFRFELYEDGKLKERNKFFIPNDF